MRATLCVMLAACSASPTGPGHWRAVHPLAYERFEAAAAALGGKVYYLGGISDRCANADPACPVADVDAYDPVADLWTPAPPLPAEAPRHHLALAVLDGKIWVVGGFTGILGTAMPFVPVGTTFSFDGIGWQRHADPPLARGAATAQAIGGKIYLAGGGTAEPDARAELQVYDPGADAWSQLPSMPTAREHVASCAVGDALVVVGGWTGTNRQALAAAERFDPAAGSWQRLPDMPTARGGLAAAILDGACHVIGGEDWALQPPGTFDAHEVWDGHRWTTRAPLPGARHGLGLAQLGEALYVIGGGPSQGNSYTIDVEEFTP